MIEGSDPLGALGWDTGRAASFAPQAAQGLVPARVIAQHRGRWTVSDGTVDRDAVLAGKARHELEPDAWPTVGDWVALAAQPAGDSVIKAVLPRRSAFRRKAAGGPTESQLVAANVDLVLIAVPLPDGLKERRIERTLALAWESGATPVLVLTKRDLCEDVPEAIALAASVAPGVTIVTLAATRAEGLDELAPLLERGKTAVLVGPSGAGKSTLTNALLGEARLATLPVLEDGRGQHTTKHRELLCLASGALLIDTPGLREVGLWGEDGLDSVFAELQALAAACKFRDCRHDQEPGCAVREAVERGEVDEARLESWRGLEREQAHLARKADARAASDAKAKRRVQNRALRDRLRQKYD